MLPFNPTTPLIDLPESSPKAESKIVTDVSILIQKSELFDFRKPQMDPIELGALLVREMNDSNGLGLSAIQLGIPLRVCAIRARPQNVVLFNPVIVHSSDETQTEVEGCLSFPGLVVKVKRAMEIRVRFKYPNEEIRTERWGGLTARVVQHEIDHLDGKLFYNRATKFHRDQAFRKHEQWQRAVRDYNKANAPKKVSIEEAWSPTK